MTGFESRADAEMQTLATPELTLEPLCSEHAAAMFDVLSDQAIYRYLDSAPPLSVEQLRALYTRLEPRRSPDGHAVWLNWVILPHGRPPVGYVQATVTSVCDAYIAYVLASRHWGRGYAHGAVKVMLEHLAAAYGVIRYLATVEIENQRSIRLLERLGFQRAGESDLQGRRLSTTERLFVRRLESTDAENAHDPIA